MCESEVAQSCPTLSDPMDCSLQGSSIHGIFQARVLEWGAIAFSNMLSRLVITFLPKSKCLLISWLQSPSAVILEPPKINSDNVSTVSPFICHEVMGLDRRSQWQSTPVLLPGKSHGWRSLVGCSPWDHEESDMTERLHFHFSLSCIGEGNGHPLQCSCLENPRDGGAWWAAIYGVAQSQT